MKAWHYIALAVGGVAVGLGLWWLTRKRWKPKTDHVEGAYSPASEELSPAAPDSSGGKGPLEWGAVGRADTGGGQVDSGSPRGTSSHEMPGGGAGWGAPRSEFGGSAGASDLHFVAAPLFSSRDQGVAVAGPTVPRRWEPV